jgi:hypothetical protein
MAGCEALETRDPSALGLPRFACYKAGVGRARKASEKMRGEMVWRRLGAGATLLTMAVALGACGSTGDIFKSSALDVFHTSSKATTGSTPTDPGIDTDVDCPEVQIRTGAATLMIGSKPGEGEPAALDLRYQGSIVRTARECHVNAGVMTMKIGIEGRIVTGPAGGPGDVNVPMRIAVVQEGVNPKTIVSKFAQIPVTVTGAVDRVTFTHIDPDLSFPLPQPLGLIDAYVVYIGFDASGAQPERKRPAARAKPVARKKPAG